MYRKEIALRRCVRDWPVYDFTIKFLTHVRRLRPELPGYGPTQINRIDGVEKCASACYVYIITTCIAV